MAGTDSALCDTLFGCLAEEIQRHRALGRVQESTLVFEVGDGRDGYRAWTLVIGDRVDVVPDHVAVPGLPSVRVTAAQATLVDLLSGRQSAAALAAADRIQVTGQGELLAGLAGCFQASDNWLSVRLRK